MKVRDLIALLQETDPDLDVVFNAEDVGEIYDVDDAHEWFSEEEFVLSGSRQ